MTDDRSIENLTAQLSELEALQSVYPGELEVSDHGVLADINDFVNSPASIMPQRLEYAVKLSLENATVELLISLPTNYPHEKPEIYARGSRMNRDQQLLLNDSLSGVLQQQEDGEPCIYSLISWLQDNAENFVDSQGEDGQESDGAVDRSQEHGAFARYWIYSHHIYSKFKRRYIAELAKDNSVTGFCLAGKPGIICMEGALEDTDYCWQKIKSWNWKKILVKFMEKQEHCSIKDSRKFANFQEISFPTTERHNDMGHLLKYLNEHELQYAFKELFGMEGKQSALPDI